MTPRQNHKCCNLPIHYRKNHNCCNLQIHLDKTINVAISHVFFRLYEKGHTHIPTLYSITFWTKDLKLSGKLLFGFYQLLPKHFIQNKNEFMGKRTRGYCQSLHMKLEITVFGTWVSIQIQKVATFNSDRKIINLIPNKSFRYYKQ